MVAAGLAGAQTRCSAPTGLPPCRHPKPGLLPRIQPKPGPLPRRDALALSICAIAATAAPAWAAASRTEGYAVQHTEKEWAKILSPQQYFILRNGGTEAPNSSPLVKEKRAGTFTCAGCGAALFDSGQKFESGTGWPSFAAPLSAVQVMDSNPMATALLGVECRCGDCGGHLGDVFLDGFLFPGTPAFATGKRYCIDGAALVFQPKDGGKPVLGEGRVPIQQELPAWLQPPKVG